MVGKSEIAYDPTFDVYIKTYNEAIFDTDKERPWK
jgi:hypothetical protein